MEAPSDCGHVGRTAPDVVAIDGLSGAGKSSVARAIAGRLGWSYLDTGACYRALTVAALEAGLLEPGDEQPPTGGLEALAVATLPTLQMSLDPCAASVRLAAVDVTGRIRDDATTRTVSAVSADAGLRRQAVAWQRAMVQRTEGCVVEGRDIGTVVLPRAPLKVWLVADADARAGRRAAQDRVSDRRAVRAGLDRRDLIDGARAVAPAVPATDAVVIDTTTLGIEQVVDRVVELAAQRGLVRASA